MRRWLLLPALVAAGLLLIVPASAAPVDVNADVRLDPLGGDQYKLRVQNTGNEIITTFAFTAGPALRIASIVSSTVGSCQLNGAAAFTCSVSLAPPPCDCNPGDFVEVVFAASGDSGGSTLNVGARQFTFGTAPVTPPGGGGGGGGGGDGGTPPATPAAVQKLGARVGPGMKVSFPARAKAGKAQITVRDLSATDNFHLTGPGLNKKTTVKFKGTVTWTVTLKKGTYAFRSDAHAKLSGKTKVV